MHRDFRSIVNSSGSSLEVEAATAVRNYEIDQVDLDPPIGEPVLDHRTIGGFGIGQPENDPTASRSRFDRGISPIPKGRIRQTADILFAFMDLVLVWLASSMSLALYTWPSPRLFGPAQPDKHIEIHVVLLLLYSAVVVLLCHAHRLYHHLQLGNSWHEAWATLRSVGLATMLIAALIFSLEIPDVSRTVIGVAGFLTATLLICWRQIRRQRIGRRVAAGRDCRNILIVGTGPVGLRLKRHLDENRQFGYLVKGFVECPTLSSHHPRTPENQQHILGSVDDLARLTRIHFIDELLIAIPHDRELVKEVALQARKHGLAARVIPDLYDGLAWGAPIEYLGIFPTMSLHQEPARDIELLLKRALDIIVSACALLAATPIMILAALAIYLDDRGPIFYRSKRVGKKGKLFDCLKLRTMVVNAEDMISSLRHLNERQGLLFKISNDPRITRAGRILRKYSVDEMPQFWNVLKGEMSLVGPRPPLATEFEQYDLEYFRRLEATPGITGVWQVEARQSASFETYINLDLYYVEHWSLMLDLKVLLKTVAVVFAGTGY